MKKTILFISLILIILFVISGCYYKWYYSLNIYYNQQEGTVTETGSKNPDNGKYAKHSVVTLEALPNNGYTFTEWTGDFSGTENPKVIQIEADTNISANFEKDEYTFTASVTGEGVIIKEPAKLTYEYGDQVELTAVPVAGWEFIGWSGDATGDSTVIQIEILANTNVIATFERIEYIISTTVNGEGEVSKSPEQIFYYYGDDVELSAQASPGWEFKNWSGDLSGTNPVKEITVNSDKNIIANFEEEKYTLVITIEGSGTVRIDPEKEEYEYGEYVELTPVASPGWFFSEWIGDQSGDTHPIIIKMNKNKEIIALFEELIIF